MFKLFLFIASESALYFYAVFADFYSDQGYSEIVKIERRFMNKREINTALVVLLFFAVAVFSVRPCETEE